MICETETAWHYTNPIGTSRLNRVNALISRYVSAWVRLFFRYTIGNEYVYRTGPLYLYGTCVHVRDSWGCPPHRGKKKKTFTRSFFSVIKRMVTIIVITPCEESCVPEFQNENSLFCQRKSILPTLFFVHFPSYNRYITLHTSYISILIST